MQNKLPLINSAHGSETRNIINELIKLFNGMGYTYDESLQKAHDILNEAKKTNNMNKDVQNQVNKFISEFESTGETNLEIVQARIDSEGNEYDVLKERLDEKETETDNITVNSLKSTKSTLAYNKSIKPTVVFTIDDGHKEDLTVIKPILDAQNYKATTYIVSDWMGKEGFLNAEELKQLEADGWEIAAHSKRHNPMGTGMNEKNLEIEFSECKNVLVKNGLNISNFAYPFGSYSVTSNEIGAKYFDTLAMFGTGHNDINTLPIRPTFLKRVALGSNFDAPKPDFFPVTNTFEDYYKPMIDKAIERDGLLVFALHSKPHSESQTQLNYLKDVVAYLKQENVNVTTLDKALEMFGNSVDIEKLRSNNYTLDKFLKVSNGELFTNMFQPLIPINADIDNNTNAVKYPTEAMSYKEVNTSQGFPFNGSILNINHTQWKDFSKQFLLSTKDNRVAYRSSRSDGSFTLWKEFAEKRPSKLWNIVDITVPAKSTIVYTIPDFNTMVGNGVVVNPTNALPFGITFYPRISAGNAHIQFQNVTDSDINVNAQFNVYLVSHN